MERFTITEEVLKNASDYAKLADKTAFVDYCTRRCITQVTVSLGMETGNDAMPDMWMEDTFLKSRYLMTAFAVLYLGLDPKGMTEEGDEWLMEAGQYDRFAGSHVFNQLERMKGNAELRDKVFDLLRDYRDLEKRLNTSVYGMLNVMNDPANRFSQKMAMDTSQTSLEEMQKELEKLGPMLEEAKQRRDQMFSAQNEETPAE